MTFALGSTIYPSDVLGLALNSGQVSGGVLTLNLTNGTSSVVVGGSFLTGIIATGALAIGDANTGTLDSLPIGSGLTIVAGTLEAVGGSSSWTAAAVNTVGSGLTVNGGGTISATGGGGGTPGGSSGQIQFNNAGTFGGVGTVGSGNVVLATSPTLVTPALGTPSALVLTNATGLPLTGHAAMTGYTFIGNATNGSAIPTAVGVSANLSMATGTLDLAPVVSYAIIGNGGTASANPGPLVLSNTNFNITSGTIYTTSTVGVVNFTSGTGIQYQGTPIINVQAATALYLGVQAGFQSQTGTIAPGLGNTFVGTQAGYTTAGASECTYLGYVAGYGNINGGHNTALGVGAMGYSAPYDFFNTYVGCDSGRNAAASPNATSLLGNNVAMGQAAGLAGGGYNNVMLGSGCQQGNSAAIYLTGSITTTDTLSLVFTSTQATSTASSISGSTLTVGGSVTNTYAVNQVLMAGNVNVGTISALGSGSGGAGTYILTSPIATGSTTIVGGVFQPQTLSVAMTGLSTITQAATAVVTAFTANNTLYQTNRRQASVQDSNNISFNLNGASQSGDFITITGSVIGAGTETITVSNGLTGLGENVFIGYQAGRGFYQTTASYNIGLGTNTFYWLTSGQYNIAMGLSSGQNITTGSNNILIGTSSGNALIAATQNVVIGSSALSIGTNNSGCVAVGYTAAEYTTGNFNTAVGTTAGVGVNGTSTYANCTLVGYAAGRALTTANGVTLIGYSAGIALTSGANNTFVGSSAGQAAQTASKSVFVGDSAGVANVSGFQNTLIGSSAGHALTGSNCTMIGYTAGNLVTGNNNTIIGNAVGSTTLTTGTGNILIGTSSSVDTPAVGTANYLNIGGVVIGTGINTASTSTVTVPGTLGVGTGFVIQVGTTIPAGTVAGGSIGINTAGTTGARVYISNGAGTWNALAGV